jgi:hypothetical protein
VKNISKTLRNLGHKDGKLNAMSFHHLLQQDLVQEQELALVNI